MVRNVGEVGGVAVGATEGDPVGPEALLSGAGLGHSGSFCGVSRNAEFSVESISGLRASCVQGSACG